MDLAVLIIGYSRPNGILSLLNALVSIKVRDIYIAIDGPRNLGAMRAQNRILEIIAEFEENSKSSIHVMTRSQNLGVAGGVLNAIDWFFSCEEMGVILEDDLIISNDFFHYALNTLTKFKQVSDVWMISGTQIFPNEIAYNEISWCNYPMIWGWASWRDKWLEMRESLLRDKPIKVRNLFDRRYLYWAIGGNRALSGKVDTWDTQLAFEFIVQKKLCVLPPVNLVSNIGNDEVASHTHKSNLSMNLAISSLGVDSYSTDMPKEGNLLKYNSLLEKRVFKIKWRHLFVPYDSFLFDSFYYPRKYRTLKLNRRSDWKTN